MSNVQFTNKAVEDFSNIWDYTYNNWSESQAEKYYALLLQACMELSGNPKAGKSYEEVDSGILGFLAYSHIILFKGLSPKKILVVRILHNRMDLKSKKID
jgi:toxin ParE1/3/4